MKSGVIALMIASANAQAADGTDDVDCGQCDATSYQLWEDNYTNSGSSCTNDASCNTGSRCVILQVSAGSAQQAAYCEVESVCEGDVLDQTLAGSTDTFSYRCNDSEDETLQGFDMRNWVWWEDTVITGALATCTTESDCGSGEACGTLTNNQWSGDGDDYSAKFCVDHDGWCAQNSAAADAVANYSDGGQFDPVNASAWEYITVSGCDGDDYSGWLWTEQDFYIQEYWNEGDCADYAETEKECTTVSWNGSAVEAWCGTATWGDYSNIACYPLDDCSTLGGPVPNPLTGDAAESDVYSLLCGSMKLVASAAAAFAVATAI